MDMMSNRSKETASDVLKTCLKLRGSTDFKKNVNEVIEDVRVLCGAEGCGLMLVDFEEQEYDVIAESLDKNSRISSIKKI